MNIRLFFVMLLVLLTACGSGSPDSSVARSVVERYYQALSTQDREIGVSLFTSRRSAEERGSHFDKVQAVFGKLLSFSITSGEVNTVLRGRFYIFEVQARYDVQGLVQETVTVFNEVGSEETTIVGHALRGESASLNF